MSRATAAICSRRPVSWDWRASSLNALTRPTRRKAKCQQRQEFIIIGYSNAKSGGRALGALYLGYHRGGALTYAGKVGTGFTMKSARALTQEFEKLTVAKPVLNRK